MENYIVSARKYRPATFRSVVGQKALTTTLKNAIQSNKLAHAYLFCGPRGVGKTTCARIFAKTINCLNPKADGEACDVCESCVAFNEQRSYNIHELDAASNNSVDDIRSLIEQVRIPPPIGKYKVFIIDEVHMLSTAAFNAFLKTLEEPPRHAIFILATTEKHKVLPTILSRCQIYDFSRISIPDIVEHLEYVASSEGVSVEPEALNVIAQKADGGMRDALSIFDQIVSFTNGQVTYQAVINNLNVLDYEYYFRLTDCVLEGNVRSALLLLNEILSKGFDGQNIITGLATHFRDLLVCRDEATLVLFEVGASIKERYKTMAKRCSDALLFKAIELANTCDLNYRASRNKRLLLELTLIQLCQLTHPLPQESDKKKAVIEPIDEVAQPTGAPKAPSSQPASSRLSSPSTTTIPVSPQVSVAPPSGQAAKPRLSARPMGLSLREMTEQKRTQVATASPQDTSKSLMETAFEEPDLVNAWNAYANTIEKQVHLKNTMFNCKPSLQEGYYFEVVVHNPGQQEELNNNAIYILPFLRERLKNGRIQMRVRLSEGNEKHLAFTPQEKYAHLLEINPALDRLRKEFDLRMDN